MEHAISYLPYIVFWSGGLAFFQINKIWVFYFIWGSIGFTLLSVFIFSNTVVEASLSNAAIKAITGINKFFGIPVVPFAEAGTVLMTGTRISGYTSLEIGTECSGLLECSVFAGLTLFYPSLAKAKRIYSLLVGGLLIYLINLLRVELIIIAIFIGGRDTIFFAHTILGRGVFFFLMIALYWFFFTKSTMIFLNKREQKAGTPV